MARTIGKIKKDKLLKIIREEIKKEHDRFLWNFDYGVLQNEIEARIPEDWYDTWEGAYNEINMLISSATCNYSHRKVVEF